MELRVSGFRVRVVRQYAQKTIRLELETRNTPLVAQQIVINLVSYGMVDYSSWIKLHRRGQNHQMDIL
jgi:hypothetical protein